MANSSARIRTCPICGLELGQKNICPVCNPQNEKETEGRQGPSSRSSRPGSAPQCPDHVSRVISFVRDHKADWDDEFVEFYRGLAGNPDFDETFEACSKVCEILKKDMPDSGKISGSLTKQVMNDLEGVFPELTKDAAFSLALDLLKKRAAASPDHKSGKNGGNTAPDQSRLEQYRQIKKELLSPAVRNDFKAVMQRMKRILNGYRDYFELNVKSFYLETKNYPLAFFSALMIPEWHDLVLQETNELYSTINVYSRTGWGNPPLWCAFEFEPESSSEPCKLRIAGSEEREFLNRYVQVKLDKYNEYGSGWQELVPKGKSVLLLYCGGNIDLCSASGQCETITARPGALLDGLRYRCRCPSHYYYDAEFAYMVSPE